MISNKAKEAYQHWIQTGDLTGDEETVREMHQVFAEVFKASLGIPQYEVMCTHAMREKNKLEDIIRARYGSVAQ